MHNHANHAVLGAQIAMCSNATIFVVSFVQANDVSRIAEYNMRQTSLIFQKTLPAGRVFFLRVFFLSKQESFFDKNKSLFLIKIRVFFFSEMIIQLFLV